MGLSRACDAPAAMQQNGGHINQYDMSDGCMSGRLICIFLILRNYSTILRVILKILTLSYDMLCNKFSPLLPLPTPFSLSILLSVCPFVCSSLHPFLNLLICFSIRFLPICLSVFQESYPIMSLTR